MSEQKHRAAKAGSGMRVFVAIDLEAEIREKIARFLDGVRGFADEARWVRLSRCT